jgi:hypothetical protein
MSPNVFGNESFANADTYASTVFHEWYKLKADDLGFSRVTPLYECNSNTLSSSRYGELIACGSNFYNAAGGLLGTTPYVYEEGFGPSIIAPDGITAYAIRPNGSIINAYQFSTGFRKVSTFTSPNPYNIDYDYTASGYLNDAVISKDGQTLFIALPAGINVIPVTAFTP